MNKNNYKNRHKKLILIIGIDNYNYYIVVETRWYGLIYTCVTFFLRRHI